MGSVGVEIGGLGVEIGSGGVEIGSCEEASKKAIRAPYIHFCLLLALGVMGQPAWVAALTSTR